MVKKIASVLRDETSLKRLKKFRSYEESYQPRDYKNRVVLKPWGFEHLIFENESVAFLLFILFLSLFKIKMAVLVYWFSVNWNFPCFELE